MDRRELFAIAAGAAAAGKASGAHRFFTDDEFAMADELAEMIIPADEKSGGARAAKVVEYIDLRLAEAFDAADRDRWRAGLKRIDELSVELNGAAFMKATPEQRTALMARISANETKPQKPEELFFRTLKDATVRAYYTSKIGIHDELEYPGNVYQRGEFAGELP
jgi:gluconate 2-dehydrogenase gamma chain